MSRANRALRRWTQTVKIEEQYVVIDIFILLFNNRFNFNRFNVRLHIWTKSDKFQI